MIHVVPFSSQRLAVSWIVLRSNVIDAFGSKPLGLYGKLQSAIKIAGGVHRLTV